jgi:hypothetical protein
VSIIFVGSGVGPCEARSGHPGRGRHVCRSQSWTLASDERGWRTLPARDLVPFAPCPVLVGDGEHDALGTAAHGLSCIDAGSSGAAASRKGVERAGGIPERTAAVPGRPDCYDHHRSHTPDRRQQRCRALQLGASQGRHAPAGRTIQFMGLDLGVPTARPVGAVKGYLTTQLLVDLAGSEWHAIAPAQSPEIGRSAVASTRLVLRAAQPVRLTITRTTWSYSDSSYWRSRDDDHTIGELATDA